MNDKAISPKRARWLLDHAVDNPKSLYGKCCLCGEKADYEVVETKEGTRCVVYSLGNRRACRDCWNYNRTLDRILDWTVKLAWQQARVIYCKIRKIVRRVNESKN